MYIFLTFVLFILLIVILVRLGDLKGKIETLTETVRAMKGSMEGPLDGARQGEGAAKGHLESPVEGHLESSSPPLNGGGVPPEFEGYASQAVALSASETGATQRSGPDSSYIPSNFDPASSTAFMNPLPPHTAGGGAKTDSPPANYDPCYEGSGISLEESAAYARQAEEYASSYSNSFVAGVAGVTGAASGGDEKSSIALALAKFVRGGYAWVAAGVIFVLVAFSLLITYLAQHNIFTVEMRIASSAVFGLVMVGVGWRLRLARPVYALIVQGGGIGLVYLAIFSAAKFANLIPVPAALALITCLIPTTIIMAVTQRSQPLAIFAFLGGFAAPILLSTGSNNYIALFSYYTILIIGIMVLARIRLWRGTGILAFVCTFAVAFAWLNTKFDAQIPLHTVIPFWWIFTLAFTLLPIIYALHEKEKSVSFADTIMALGTPFLGLHLHNSVLNAHYSEVPGPFSLSTYKLAAILAFGVFYLLFAFALNKKMGKRMRLITESMLASSVCMVVLCIFLKLSSSVDIATFVTLAAVIFCFAIKERRASIAILAIVAYFAYIPFVFFAFGGYAHPLIVSVLPGDSEPYIVEHYPVSVQFTNFIIMAALAFLMGIICCKNSSPKGAPAYSGEAPGYVNSGEDWLPTKRERFAEVAQSSWGLCLVFGRILIITGFIWWIAAWSTEEVIFFGDPTSTANLALFLSTLLFYAISRKAKVTTFTWFTLLMLVVGAGKVIGNILHRTPYAYSEDINFYAYNFFGTAIEAIMWLAFLGSQYFLLVAEKKRMPLHVSSKTLNDYMHAAWLCVLVLATALLTTFTLRAHVDDLLLASSWASLAGIVPVLAFAIILVRMGSKNAALPAPHRWSMLLLLPVLLWGSVAIWFLRTLFVPGDPSPLSLYLPLLNPIELQQAFCIVILAIWQGEARKSGNVPALSKRALSTTIDVMVFLWLNSMLARAYHFYAGVPMEEVFAESGYQLGLLALLGVYGISHMVVGNKLKVRRIWIAGALITVLDILKLLLVDMAHSGTIQRIAAFFVAGIFLMFVGWAAPLPVSGKQKKHSPEGSGEDKAEARYEV